LGLGDFGTFFAAAFFAGVTFFAVKTFFAINPFRVGITFFLLAMWLCPLVQIEHASRTLPT
jgi:hypothetical protein